MQHVAAILVTYNSARTVGESIQSLIDYCPRDMPIVVVDNCSTDATIQIVSAFGGRVRLIQNEINFGFGTANNIGMRAINARYYYLHNIDAYINAGSLDVALAAMAADPEIGVAGLSLVYPDGRAQISAYAFSSPLKWLLQVLRVQNAYRALAKGMLGPMLSHFAKRSSFGRSYAGIVAGQIGSTPLRVDWVTGAAMLLSYRAWERTGGFYENIFLYSEDEDLCRRVSQSGLKIVLVRNVPFIHELGWHRNKRQASYSAIKFASKQVFIRKHFTGWRFLAMSLLLRIKRATNID